MEPSLNHELPLVIFTIAAQMSVGSFVALGLLHLFNARVPGHRMDRVADPALYAIGPLLVLGLAASTMHLGSPLRAVNALRHLETSWLSREILAGILFAALGALFALAQYFKWFGPRARQLLALLTSAVGVFLVFAISQVYSLRTVPAWSTFHTPVRFFITTFLLGALAVGAALVVAGRIRARRGEQDPADQKLIARCVRMIALGGIVALGLKFIGLPAYLGYLGASETGAAQESLHILVDTYGGFSAAQTILIFLGIVALGFLLYRMSGGDLATRLLPSVAVLAFALVLGGEVIGRMLFYASMVRLGL